MGARGCCSALALGGLAAAMGCGESCDDPPPPPTADSQEFGLIGAKFLDSVHVELAFSQPLQAPDGVDPAKFRLSVAHLTSYTVRGDCEVDTNYCDLSRGMTDFGCGHCGGYYGYVDEGEPCASPTAVTALALDPDDPTRLRLSIDPPLRPLVCDQVEYVGDDGAIVVHFSSFDIPTITAEDARELAPIAPEFVLRPGDGDSHRGAFPDRDTLVAVACPEGS